MKIILIRCSFLTLLVVLPLWTIGQTEEVIEQNILTVRQFRVKGKIIDQRGDRTSCSIFLFLDDDSYKIFPVRSDGKFQMSLPFGHQYRLLFAKEGYYVVESSINTEVPEHYLKENDKYPIFRVEIALFKRVEGIVPAFNDKKLLSIFFNADMNDFDVEALWDTRSMIEEFNMLIAERNSLNEESEWDDELEKERKLREREYQKHIDRGDQRFEKGRWNDAIEAYKKAIAFFSDRDYPNDRVAELELLIAQQESDKAEGKQNATANSLKKQVDRYPVEVRKASEAVERKNYIQALTHYQRALTYRPGDVYCTEKIAIVRQLMRDQISIQENYKQYIAQADKAFHAKEWERAKTYYQYAQQAVPEEKYPQKQIAEIEKRLSSSLSKKKRALFLLISRKAEANYKQGNYGLAKAYYKQLLSIDPNAAEVDSMLNLIEETIAKDRVERRQKLFDSYIQRGDEARSRDEYALAKYYYDKALSLSVDDVAAERKLLELEGSK